MNRRSFLATTASGLTVTSGCLSSGGRDTDEPGSPTTRSPTPDTPPLARTNDAYGTGFTPGDAWPVHGFDANRRCFNPETRPPTGDVGAAWLRTPIEGTRTFQTTPPITDERHVFVGSGAGKNADEDRHGGFIAAFDGDTGDRTWRTPVTTGTIQGVTYTNEMVLVVSTIHGDPAKPTLTALAASDGQTQWEVELPANQHGSPIVTDGRVYVTSHEGGLTAVSLDGTHLWDRAVAEGDEHASTVPCATGSTMFVGTDRGTVVAFAADDGHELWRTDVVDGGHRPRIQTMPTVIGETLFVSGTDYRLYAVATADGTPRWDTRLLDQSYGNSIPSVAVIDDSVYINTIHGGLIALRRADGSERWRTGAHGGNLPPAAAGELILAPKGETVAAYTAGGERAWTFEMPAFEAPGMAAYIMNPRISLAHNRVYISLNDGRVFSLGAQ